MPNKLIKQLSIIITLLLLLPSINANAAVKVGSYFGNWSAKTTYFAGDLITFNDKTFLSLVSRNLNKNPDANPTSWQLLGGVGAQGLQGLVGPAGSKGDTGAIGPQGTIGLTGPQGLKGDTGTSSTASHSAPVFVDANGAYIGTFLNKTSQELFPICSSSIPPACSYGVNLILPSDYFLTISDNGELTSLISEAWDNNNCSGPANLTSDFSIVGNIVSVSYYIPTSPPIYFLNIKTNRYQQRNTFMYSPDPYYLPFNTALYNGSAYAWGVFLNPTTTNYDAECQQVTGDFYKLILNNQDVTSYDPVYINSLQKPFHISIN